MLSILNSLLSAIPSFLLAIVLLILAFVCAAIVKGLVSKLLKAMRAEQYLSKLGVKDTATNSAIEFVAKLVYFITFLAFMPGVLSKLGLSYISSPIDTPVHAFVAYIPSVIASIVIVVVGFFIANIVKELLVPVLKAIKVDVLQEKTGIKTGETTFSVIIAKIVYAFICIVVITAALSRLNIPVVTSVGLTIIGYLPSIIVALIILIAGLFCAGLLENFIVKKFPSAKGAACIAKVVVYVLVAFMCLNQLGVAPAIVNKAFELLLAAVAVAFAIAFGIGGRDFAAHMLAKLEKKIDDNK